MVRLFKRLASVLLAIVIISFAETDIWALTPQNLRCEYRVNPQGMDAAVPRLSWDFGVPSPTCQNEKQTAYKIVVDLVAPFSGKESVCWDSGWVVSDRMAQIAYAGKPLCSDRTYRWSVQVRDASGQETSSPITSWTTGLFDQDQWSAKWIGSDQVFNPELGIKGFDNNIDDPWLRKTISLKEKPVRAVMFVASIGYHELYVNGKKIADHVLAPNVSNHTRRARYIAYDIAGSLKVGDNVIAIWLGTGWSIFQGYISPGLARTPQVIAQSDLYFASGSRERIVTDASWKVFPSPNRLLGSWNFGNYGGERWDDSRSQPGWNTVGFDDSRWKQATVYHPRPLVAPRINSKNDPNRIVAAEELLAKGKPLPLTAQMSVPNRLQKEIRPVRVENKGDNIWRIDMGINFAGWTEIKLVGKPGDIIKIEFSENEKLQMTFRNRSEFVIGPTGKGTFRNRFNYSSGRWITLIGLREKPALDSVCGWSVRTDFEPAGSFESSDELLNWIYRTVRWTYENLSVGGYVVDCPQRERFGYGGDAHATTETGMFNYHLPDFYAKWLEDWRDVQGREPLARNLNDPKQRDLADGGRYFDSGVLPNTAPTVFGGGGPAWGGICVTLPWFLYNQYGDTRVLQENFSTMVFWLDFLETHVQDGILQNFGAQYSFLADWLWPGDPKGRPDKVFFNSCYYVFNLTTAANIADVLGETSQADRWRKLAQRSRIALHEKYWNGTGHTYLDGTQPILGVALLAEIPPAPLRESVMKSLEKEILVNKQGHIGAGITGGSLLFKLLRQTHRDDLVLQMLLQTGYPGWGFMRANGATTIWEAWEKDRRGHSLLHSSFLFPDAWCIDSLLGIRADSKSPGFRQIVIHFPRVETLSLRFARGSYRSISGRIDSEWQKNDDHTTTFRVGVPPNCTAEILVPAKSRACVKVSQGVQWIADENGYARYRASSGIHVFNVK